MTTTRPHHMRDTHQEHGQQREEQEMSSDTIGRIARMEQDVAALGTIVGVFAHPDDETYVAGGLFALARRAGNRVVLVTATKGERGTDDPRRFPPSRLAGMRQRELEDAMRELGVDEHEWLGFEDGTLASVPAAHGMARVRRVLAEVRPDTVITFGPDGMTGHDDHRAISRWTTSAWASTVPDAALLYGTVTPQESERYSSLLAPYGVYCGSDTALGVTETDRLALQLQLRGELLDRKYRALQAMPSQTAGLIGALGSDVYRAWCSEESFVSAVDVPGEAFIGRRLSVPAFELAAA
jgi:LmbE family N-acetylglucosaminyl deacetylase